jgi:diadenosine tetraphosphate (Ap4A) HIT family hydrolase
MELERRLGCPHCDRLEKATRGELLNLLMGTEQVIVIAGDHQYFLGYCVVIAKTHIREMHNLPERQALDIFSDVLRVGRVIEEHFKPIKMNYVCLGNVDEHLHWHVIPRYKDDPDHKDHPWKNSVSFATRVTTSDDIKNLQLIFSRT